MFECFVVLFKANAPTFPRSSDMSQPDLVHHLVQVEGFWMDEHDVTNAEFSKFVEATGYVTTAERKIDLAGFKEGGPARYAETGRQRSCTWSAGVYSNLWTVPLNDLSAWWRWCTCAKLASFGLQNDEGLIHETN